MSFYDTLAPDYDSMTRFNERLLTEEALLKPWITPNVRTVLDAACGTGLHAVLLSKMGLTVTGLDNSESMLALARKNCGPGVKLVHGSLSDLTASVTPGFDAVFCLGNSLPHLLTPDALNGFLASAIRLLNPGGFLLVQQLNYDRVLDKQERIVGVNKSGNREFIRFYDFGPDTLQFNTLVITENQGKLTHQLASTELKPYRQTELDGFFRNNGYINVECFGALTGPPFDKHGSPNLIIRAGKTV